ncbi:SIR2 family NAD-dependent protein deacylase [Mesobacillus jeotgali]|uniref:SIR2 family NAD-dependent protein deacylase n=1 Tax=Mesobacillus jeotgali TaxID=129985 RepID=UPI001784044D|nr:Sir2 family NAD-dependent protein deacetylase [Mesobacillus jeotgali]UYZ21739.1 hypothetical protein FOF60_22535 [Mesobacillus jeotgali]
MSYFDARLTIRDLNYQNQYGTFVLCDYTFDAEEREKTDSAWEIRKGAPPNTANPYEIMHVLRIPSIQHLSEAVGYVIRNIEKRELLAVSYREAWKFLFHEGAINGVATISRHGNFTSYLIDSIEELPAFDSAYWGISPYDSDGKPVATFTKEVQKNMEHSLKREINSRIKRRITQLDPGYEGKPQDQLKDLAELIKASGNITVLTGAGISTMSGIPDYRSAIEGVWRKKPDLLQTLNQFVYLREPELFWKSYYDLFALTLDDIIPYPTKQAVMTAIDSIVPNDGHAFFADLEKAGKQVSIITQNVDGLHQKACSSRVIEFHGNVMTCSCPVCDNSYKLEEFFEVGTVPRCECGTVLRPDVVFFGDAVKGLDIAEELIADSDLMIIAGTSLNVSPFNLLPGVARELNIPIVYINNVITEENYDITLQGDISNVCTQLKEFLSGHLEK